VKFGATFPTHEIGTDPGAIRAFAQAAEDLGFDYLVAIDHVLGVDRERHPGYAPIAASEPRYFLDFAYHELFVLFGFLAAVTERVGLVTGVLVLPQRQTALVAKQAAEVDLLSGGRLTLGVGVGHTDIESAALGTDHRTRGRRIEEQILVLRRLWSEPSVTFHGEFHDLDGVGLNPRPDRLIPIWMGGWSTPVLERAARLADGLMMPRRRDDVLALVAEHGRDPARFGFSDTVILGPDDDAAVAERVRAAAGAGITHLGVNGQSFGRRSCDEHIAVLERFKAIAGF
jgi:probable F420-dependent oxidoreductase